MLAEARPKWFIVESRFVDRLPITSGAKVICVDSGAAPERAEAT